jgi:hypothetical protein|tara:strand:+ start:1895 stop:2293 length:399 start_codon:yes stop_codon:yes gene_type:complete
MKNYIGIKEVKARPMNRLDYNGYRGWDLPSDEDGEDEGYLVEYANASGKNHQNHDGYITWSPKDPFEEAYRETTTYQDRLKIEYNDLCDKVEKLAKALEKDLVPSSQQPILIKQLSVMGEYSNILLERIALA